ncbi:MAG: asparagine synthase (glutamine-hydrolyzing) [Magnetococcales bacterium]|nr:asparagine synthase (glutamine-hydrolyzing) [Magnetococcales bacterium]
MCGICGMISTAPEGRTAATGQWVAALAAALAHRGPDDAGFWQDEQAAFGHRRLAIIDLSVHGRQPMTNEDGTLVLVCNGEIYNAPELRRELVQRGHVFRSRTDVEVILHLYEEFGEDCLDHLVGMFAWALWDAPRCRLFMARDRIGEKPLHYTRLGHRLFFASEAQALLRLPELSPQLNPEAVANLLIYGASPAPLTFFAGIQALPPATCLRWQDGTITLRRYWRLTFADHQPAWSWPAALERYDELLGRSVTQCLAADVPLGVMLSGGVDSSSIAVHAIRHRPDLETFCVGYRQGDRPDPEFHRAELVARRIGSHHHAIPFDTPRLNRLPAIVAQYGQPLNLFPMMYMDPLAAAMAQQVKVVLGGNGADEVLGGYAGYNGILRQEQLLFPLLRRLPDRLRDLVPALGTHLAPLGHRARAPLAQRRGLAMEQHFRAAARRLFTPGFQQRILSLHPGRWLDEYTTECQPRDYLDTVRYSDLMLYHQHSTNLVADIPGMHHALEIRSPFLDHRLIEFAATLPRPMTTPGLFSSRRNKALAKRAMEPHLPQAILYGRKLGFGYHVPFRELIQRTWRPAVDWLLHQGRYRELDIFDPRTVGGLPDQDPQAAWMVLVFAVWAEVFLFGTPTATLAERFTALESR